MLKMFLKTAHHIGEVFKQPKEQLLYIIVYYTVVLLYTIIIYNI